MLFFFFFFSFQFFPPALRGETGSHTVATEGGGEVPDWTWAVLSLFSCFVRPAPCARPAAERFSTGGAARCYDRPRRIPQKKRRMKRIAGVLAALAWGLANATEETSLSSFATKAAAGALAGGFTNGLLHPLDTLKTLRQADGSRYRNTAAAAKALVRQRGVSGLYGGIVPAVLGAMPSSAMYFGTYDFVKDGLTALSADLRARTDGRVCLPRAVVHASAAAAGNVASSLIFIPKELIKQRSQLAGAAGFGFFGVARTVVREEGIAGLYAGYRATVARNVPSAMLRFVAFEELKVALDVRKHPEALLLAGGAAGVVASAATTPLDVIKTRFATGKIPRTVGVSSALAKVWREEGARALWAGAQPRMLWSAIFTGVGFSAFECFKEKLEGARTPAV